MQSNVKIKKKHLFQRTLGGQREVHHFYVKVEHWACGEVVKCSSVLIPRSQAIVECFHEAYIEC